jgi:hypothetical protein
MNNKPYAIQKNSDVYGLKKTDKSVETSALLDCSFWLTKYEDIYVTDYDFNTNEDLEEKGILMLYFMKGNFRAYQKFSIVLLENQEQFNQFLELFYNECIEDFNRGQI